MKPRLGFVGLGWIGLARMRAVQPQVEVVGVCDPNDAAVRQVLAQHPDLYVAPDLSALLELDLDGVVIATPSSLHAEQSAAALDHAVPVFCQKPLGRDASEVRGLVRAAQRADRLLGVDVSYRGTRALQTLAQRVREGAIGEVYAADLVFHNAYGPDKGWYRDRAASGGGCLVDLGLHLVDAALWVLGFPEVVNVRGARWAAGRRLCSADEVNEDHAVVQIAVAGGAELRVSCSWWLAAGQDAEIGVDVWGTTGSLRLRNVGGSFYDFELVECHGTQQVVLCAPPDAWGGRTLSAWAERVLRDRRFDPAIEEQIRVAEILDAAAG